MFFAVCKGKSEWQKIPGDKVVVESRASDKPA
jgi:hypothetical protein